MGETTEYRLRLGVALETARGYRGLTQEYVGRLVGAEGSTLGRWERGENEPGVEHVALLARVLDIPPDWVVNPPASRARALVLLGAYDELRAGDPPPGPSQP